MENQNKEKISRLKQKIKRYPVFSSIVFTLLLGMVTGMFFWIGDLGHHQSIISIFQFVLLLGGIYGAFIFYPMILSGINMIKLFVCSQTEEERRTERRFEIVTFLIGTIYTVLFISISDIRMGAEWSEQLYNSQMHQPVWTEAVPTVIVLCVVGVIGYMILSFVDLEKLPPLVAVLSISAMYLGMMECVLWMIQTMSTTYWILSLFPANCIIIGIKTIRYKIAEWNSMERKMSEMFPNEDFSEQPMLNFINKILKKAELWPILALVFMLPLLGILLGILILFGQKPDAVIKAWTETANWRLSQQIPPQNVMYDEHYLCTVAAGGHEKIVKPLRMGQRHGHRVVVNRQLCIANAFEQILEERTPNFHRKVRHFYDTYGFPIARLIHTKVAADVVYILMKPLEWIFLCVIYLCDTKPENRIAVQYLPKCD